jgi:hypothetical protein
MGRSVVAGAEGDGSDRGVARAMKMAGGPSPSSRGPSPSLWWLKLR